MWSGKYCPIPLAGQVGKDGRKPTLTPAGGRADGRHSSTVFFTHYRKNERRRGPALDCRTAGSDNWMIVRNAKNRKNQTTARARLAGGKRRPA
jgi:hypothetical protein